MGIVFCLFYVHSTKDSEPINEHLSHYKLQPEIFYLLPTNSAFECNQAALDAAVSVFFHPLKALEGSFNSFRRMMRGEQNFHENIFSLITHDNGVVKEYEMEMTFWALFTAICIVHTKVVFIGLI